MAFGIVLLSGWIGCGSVERLTRPPVEPAVESARWIQGARGVRLYFSAAMPVGEPWGVVFFVLGPEITAAEPFPRFTGPLDSSTPLQVVVSGVPVGGTPMVSILADCDRDGRPDRTARPGCLTPIASFLGSAPDAAGRSVLLIPPSALPPQPDGGSELLDAWWVSASLDGARSNAAAFTRSDNACTVWATLADLPGGACQPGLRGLWTPHLGPSPGTTEVHRIAVGAVDGNAGRVVSGTDGATGVAWAGRDWLIFTREATNQGAAGLYAVSPAEGPASLLVEAPPGTALVAPGVTPDGQIWVMVGGGDRWAPARLDAGRLQLSTLWLAEPINRLAFVGGDPDLLLGVGDDDAYGFVAVMHPAEGGVETYALSEALRLTTYCGASADERVVELDDRSGTNRGELFVVDQAGRPLRRLASGPADERGPSCQRDGRDIAWLTTADAEPR